jgi:hypothetical protein
MPKSVQVDFEGISPYSQSRQHDTPRKDRETWDDYEERTWKEKCWTNDAGEIVLPAMGIKQALDAVSKRLGDQIPGKGKRTYTKAFTSGVIVEEDVVLKGCRKDNCGGLPINANADGVRGSGKRVKRKFPQWPKWSGTAKVVVMDDTVTKDVFERYFTEAGRFIGVGRFRPENGGLNGRFRPLAFRWAEL